MTEMASLVSVFHKFYILIASGTNTNLLYGLMPRDLQENYQQKNEVYKEQIKNLVLKVNAMKDVGKVPSRDIVNILLDKKISPQDIMIIMEGSNQGEYFEAPDLETSFHKSFYKNLQKHYGKKEKEGTIQAGDKELYEVLKSRNSRYLKTMGTGESNTEYQARRMRDLNLDPSNAEDKETYKNWVDALPD